MTSTEVRVRLCHPGRVLVLLAYVLRLSRCPENPSLTLVYMYMLAGRCSLYYLSNLTSSFRGPSDSLRQRLANTQRRVIFVVMVIECFFIVILAVLTRPNPNSTTVESSEDRVGMHTFFK